MTRVSLTEVAKELSKVAIRMSALAADTNGHVPKKATRRIQVRPSKRTAELRLHGRYLGAIHALSIRNRARAKKIRADKGVHAAIRFARSLAG